MSTIQPLLKHPAECGLIVHTQTHSAGWHDAHAVSLSSVRANPNFIAVLDAGALASLIGFVLLDSSTSVAGEG